MDPATFSIYASTSWAHFKINEPLIFHIYGPHCENVLFFIGVGGGGGASIIIMDPFCSQLSSPTSIYMYDMEVI